MGREQGHDRRAGIGLVGEPADPLRHIVLHGAPPTWCTWCTLFGIHPGTAARYVYTAHPDRALPRIR